MRAALIAIGLLAGCVDGTGGHLAVPQGDYEAFEATVQPILSRRCAQPGCHGDASRPLELFAVQRHRADPDLLHLDVPLTPEERMANHLRVCGFLVGIGAADESLLLRKTLPAALGGVHHVGGVVFEDRDEAEFIALRDWIHEALGGAP